MNRKLLGPMTTKLLASVLNTSDNVCAVLLKVFSTQEVHSACDRDDMAWCSSRPVLGPLFSRSFSAFQFGVTTLQLMFEIVSFSYNFKLTETSSEMILTILRHLLIDQLTE